MRWERLFLTGQQLRPIWRFLLSLPMMFIAFAAASLVQGFVFGRQTFPISSLLHTILLFPALLAASKLLTGSLDLRPLGTVGLAFRGRWLRELGWGLLIGSVMILAVAALERVFGVARFTLGTAPAPRLLLWAGGLLLFGVIAAMNEELVFRGYPFQRLVEAAGAIVAVGVCSALFGVAHLGGPYHTWISTLNTALVGVPLAIAYLRTRLLWLPIGMHFAWNFVQGFVLGLPVSGLQIPSSLFQAEVRGNPLLTGGNYGPEASLLATAVVVLAAGYLGFAKSIYISEETKALVFAPATKTDLPETSLRLEAERTKTSGRPPRMN